MPAKPDSKTRILDAAFELFHAQGVHATGLDQILSASGTGKGQFYHYFASKEELLLQLLRRFRAKLASGEIPLKQELESCSDLEQWFGFFLTVQETLGCQRSCPIGTIAAEIEEDESPLRAEACAIFAAARQPLVRLFERMRERGELASAAEPVALADFCYAIMQGGLLVTKIERRIEPLRNAVRHALDHVRSLRGEA